MLLNVVMVRECNDAVKECNDAAKCGNGFLHMYLIGISDQSPNAVENLSIVCCDA